MEHTFKAGDLVVVTGERFGRFTDADLYEVVQGPEKLVVYDDNGDDWWANGGIHKFLPAPVRAPNADTKADAVLAFIKGHYHDENRETQGAYQDLVRRVFGMEIKSIPATVEFLPVPSPSDLF